MVSLVQSLKNRLASSLFEKQTTHYDRYKELMDRIISDDVIDPQEAAAVLDAIGRSWDQLESDVAVYRKRLANRRRLDAKAAAEKSLGKLRAEHQALVDELDACQQRLMPRINSTFASIQTAEQVVMAASSAETELRSSCLDPAIQARQSAISEELKTLVTRSRELEHLLSTTHREGFRAVISDCVRQIDEIRGRVGSGSPNTESGRYYQTQLDEKQTVLDALERRRDATEVEFAKLKTRIAELHAEQRKLDERKLVP